MHKFKNIFLLWRGRISRKSYWLCGLAPAIILSVIGWRLDPPLWVTMMVALAILYMGTMLSIKRSHDLGYTGFFSLVLTVPILNLWPLVLFGFFEGAEEDNRYGPPDRRFPNLFVDE